MIRFFLPRALVPAVLFFALAGCGPTDGTVAVTGSVTLDGEPVGTRNPGVIRFAPVGTGRGGETVIKDGKFAARLQPGEYSVGVSWQKPTGKKLNPGATGPGADAEEVAEVIPTKDGAASTLTAKVGDGAALDFTLTSK